MKEEYQQLQRSIDERNNQKSEIFLSSYIQLLSAVIFICEGCVLFFKDLPIFALPFFFEGAGQIFLGIQRIRDTKNGLKGSGRYFLGGNLSHFALGFFWLCGVSRFFEVTTIPLAFLFGLIFLILYFVMKKKVRSDMRAGVIIILMAISFGIVSENELRLFSLSYAFLIIFGAFGLKPSRAELINIFLWSVLFFSQFS